MLLASRICIILAGGSLLLASFNLVSSRINFMALGLLLWLIGLCVKGTL